MFEKVYDVIFMSFLAQNVLKFAHGVFLHRSIKFEVRGGGGANVSLKENKPDGVNPNSNDIDCYVRKNEGKILWLSADCIDRVKQNTVHEFYSILVKLVLLKQKRMRFKPIKSRLFCWTGGQEQ